MVAKFKAKMLQKGGVIDDPEMMFRDRYNTQLTFDEERRFQEWLSEESKRRSRDISMDMGTYDLKGFWKYDNTLDKDNHGSDKWKKPNHPKFTNESIYDGADGFHAGKWEGDSFYPSKQTVDLYGEEGLQRYFNEPNRPEHLNMNRFKFGVNKPSPFKYKAGGKLPTGGKISKGTGVGYADWNNPIYQTTSANHNTYSSFIKPFVERKPEPTPIFHQPPFLQEKPKAFELEYNKMKELEGKIRLGSTTPDSSSAAFTGEDIDIPKAGYLRNLKISKDTLDKVKQYASKYGIDPYTLTSAIAIENADTGFIQSDQFANTHDLAPKLREKNKFYPDKTLEDLYKNSGAYVNDSTIIPSKVENYLKRKQEFNKNLQTTFDSFKDGVEPHAMFIKEFGVNSVNPNQKSLPNVKHTYPEMIDAGSQYLRSKNLFPETIATKQEGGKMKIKPVVDSKKRIPLNSILPFKMGGKIKVEESSKKEGKSTKWKLGCGGKIRMKK